MFCIFSGVGEVGGGTKTPPAQRKQVRGGKRKKAGWSLPDTTEEELVEWLRNNSYLWLRSTKDYKKKREAWSQKAQELKISLEHLQKWYKNLKDWYVKLLKKTSGQARKPLTGRDKWVLRSLSFYQSQCQAEEAPPDTVNALVRSSGSTSSGSAPGPSASRVLDDDENILSDIEANEAERAREATTTTTTTTTASSRRRTPQQDPEWSAKLIDHMQQNHDLLERVLLPQAHSVREVFVRYASDLLRTVADEEFVMLRSHFEQGVTMMLVARQRTNISTAPPPQPSTSTAPPPQPSTSTAPPPQPSTSTAPPPQNTFFPTPARPTPSTTPLGNMSFLNSPTFQHFLAMDHPPRPEAVSSLSTPEGRPSAEYVLHNLPAADEFQ